MPGQPLPVDFTVRARLTTSHLSITPTTLDFGRCLTCEKKGLVLQLHNDSALPQAVSFGALPQGLSLSPNDGFARLLPSECKLFSFVQRVCSCVYAQLLRTGCHCSCAV